MENQEKAGPEKGHPRKTRSRLIVLAIILVPVLVVVNVPARILAQPLSPESSLGWPLACFALVATAVSLRVSRWVFQRALVSYRSASS